MVPRSDLMRDGNPLRLTNLVKAAMKPLTDKLDTTSKWTAFDAKHTKTHRYALTDLAFLSKLDFTKYGPAKSVAVPDQGRAAVTLSAGKSDMNGG